MSSWSKRRKTLYASVTVLFLLGAIVVPAFLILYKPASCFDGVKNGKEQGVDCGGSCSRLCQSAFLPPSVGWTRFEEVAPGLYNISAYIINPNIEGEALHVPYVVTLYDDRGVPIIDSPGRVTIPPHRNTVAFQGAVPVGKRVPSKVLFEFSAPPNWSRSSDQLTHLMIGDKSYTEDESGSSLTVDIENNDVRSIEDISVYVVLYDEGGNAVGFSRTILDEIPPQKTAVAPFTWPINRHGKVVSIEVLPVLEHL